MCIVIDTNTFGDVFKPTSHNHSKFKPVYMWIINGNGKIVYGGSKYEEELRKASSYLALFAELKRANKIVIVNKNEVDTQQQKVERQITHTNFNDSHLIAIIIVSGCKLICTGDKKCHQFLKRRDVYPSGINKPKIYSNESHEKLLCEKNMASICR